jgi:uncharacterized DUF497 family protein
MKFDWHTPKAKLNERKHGVTFEEASTVFNDARRLQIYDLPHSIDEDREITIGFSYRMRLLMVVYYERDQENIRIISARRATKEEGLRYFAES